MSRLILVVLMGLINFGLGFATAVWMRRGPWSRDTSHAPQATYRTSSNPEAATVPERVPASVEQLAVELEQAEQRFESLLASDSEPSRSTISETDLFAAVQATLRRLDDLVPHDDLSTDASQRVVQGLDTLRTVLTSARDELQQVAVSPSSPPDPIRLAENLRTCCQEARGAFTALLFSDQST